MVDGAWNTVQRGRVRGPKTGAGGPPTGGPGGAGAGAGPGERLHHGGGGGGGRGRARTQFRQRDARANVYERPNTVVIECQEFIVLPQEHELTVFLYEQVLKEHENKKVFTEIQTLFCDKNARRYLIRMKTPESTVELAELLCEGVSWPGYPNEAEGRDVIVKGYSMEKPIMDITLSGVGWWTAEDVVRKVVETWGEVKTMTKEVVTYHGHTITTDKWKIKLIKRKDIQVPPVVLHAGSERNADEREMWEVFYRGVPKVCYKCLKPGHMGRDCKDKPVDLDQLASQPEYEQAPAAVVNQQELEVPKTFAQIVAEGSYTAARVARQAAADLKKEAIATKVREEKERRERRKKEKESSKENLTEKSLERENDSDDDIASQGGVLGSSQELGTPWDPTDWAQEVVDQEHKRSAPSPPANAPDNKTPRISPVGSRSSSASGARRKVPHGTN